MVCCSAAWKELCPLRARGKVCRPLLSVVIDSGHYLFAIISPFSGLQTLEIIYCRAEF